ncbi:sigma-54 dependent transcriptional regulator [bacterium]|nr:sigma-54 dependent transcriptional regulator [bacterium]
MKSILVSTKKTGTLESIAACLENGNQIDLAVSETATSQKLQEKVYNILFLDIDQLELAPTRKDALKLIRTIFARYWEYQPTLEIVVVCPRDRIREAVTVVKAGANDYITYPIDRDEIGMLVSTIYEERILHSELAHFRDRFWAEDAEADITTRSDVMQTVLNQIKSVAPTRSTILLTGETGTGKTRLAKLIHRHSGRKDGPFLSINCGAMPDTLIESELFGHEKGSFTGAIRLKLGKFEIARGGTLFLDEVGTISPAAQVKLLNVIQDGEFQRVGGENTIKTDIRLIAATNMNLSDLVKTGEFRKDLYYRLNVFPIAVPSLKDRSNDIPLLVDGIIQKINKVNNKTIKGIHASAMEILKHYDWPGNIRELENLLERAHILETSDTLTPDSFPREIISTASTTLRNPSKTASAETLMPDSPMTLADMRRQAADQAEYAYLQQLLARHQGKIALSAEEAGISTRQLNKLLHKHGIQKEGYKQKKSRSQPVHVVFE